MTQLSILIPTVVGREEQFDKLYQKLHIEYKNGWYGRNTANQFKPNPRPIEVYYLCDNKKMSIGEKREILYELATAPYSWQIDDDDDISDDAIDLILKAINKNPDCITFEEYVNIDGKEFRSNHSLEYDDWADNFGGFDFVRTPFFKSVIKTEIARSIPIPHIRFGEDHEWAKALKSHLKTEVHIPEQLYKYIHISSDHNTRYGIK